MSRVRLGAVGYLNARPLTYGLDRSPRFDLRYDVPSKCAGLLHAGAIDLGMIPSIEYLRQPGYRIVPDLAIASRGAVASVLLFSSRPIGDVRSIAMDTSSRTSVALVRVLCARRFGITPALEPLGPDVPAMLSRCDAALVIGDNALLADPAQDARAGVEARIDVGEVWTQMTGLPFVWAFWAGPSGSVSSAEVDALQKARDEGVERPREIAGAYFPGAPAHQEAGARYLRDNIKYGLGPEERAALDLFYRYAVEAGVTASAASLDFF
jgi:chorismate dehydratase